MWHLRAAPDLPLDAHKGLAGRVFCVCGSDDMPGAAVLVARAAQRAGAGLVTLASPARALAWALPAAAPEALLAPWTSAAALRKLARQRDDHARLAGPGLGANAITAAAVRMLLASGGDTPLVLDADALNVVAGDWRVLLRANMPLVLTPHPGEAARLLGRTFAADDRARVAAAREISTRSGAICCLKGRSTVVADGDRVYLNATGNPGMATAGTGDVLSGVVVAYLAACRSGVDPNWTPWDAVCTAVHVHGLAGDLARTRFGLRGLVASDLVDLLPAAQERLRETAKLD